MKRVTSRAPRAASRLNVRLPVLRREDRGEVLRPRMSAPLSDFSGNLYDNSSLVSIFSRLWRAGNRQLLQVSVILRRSTSAA
jgi:hypothetical protein